MNTDNINHEIEKLKNKSKKYSFTQTGFIQAKENEVASPHRNGDSYAANG